MKRLQGHLQLWPGLLYIHENPLPVFTGTQLHTLLSLPHIRHRRVTVFWVVECGQKCGVPVLSMGHRTSYKIAPVPFLPLPSRVRGWRG